MSELGPSASSVPAVAALKKTEHRDRAATVSSASSHGSELLGLTRLLQFQNGSSSSSREERWICV